MVSNERLESFGGYVGKAMDEGFLTPPRKDSMRKDSNESFSTDAPSWEPPWLRSRFDSIESVSSEATRPSFALPGPPSTSNVGEPLSPRTPRTPRTRTETFSTPPPRVKSSARPPLLQALRSGSEDLVSCALREDPDAAKECFWSHGYEPLICSAVRLKCSPSIVRRLLEHGADPEAEDVHGQTPSQIVSRSCDGMYSECAGTIFPGSHSFFQDLPSPTKDDNSTWHREITQLLEQAIDPRSAAARRATM